MQTKTKPISILSDVLGPVMRGPSSSHTAGAFHIGALDAPISPGDVQQIALEFRKATGTGKDAPIVSWFCSGCSFSQSLGR